MSQRPAEEVSEYERQYQDGSDPKVRDIIDLVLIEPRPKNYQSENWLLDANAYWEKSGTASWDEITALADSPASLWINGHSTGKGMNDQIPLTAVTGIASSLTLIHVLATQLVVWQYLTPA